MKRWAPWLYLVVSHVLIYGPLIFTGFIFQQFWLSALLIVSVVVSQCLFFALRANRYNSATWALLVPFVSYLIVNIGWSMQYCSVSIVDGCMGDGSDSMWFNALPLLLVQLAALGVQVLLFRWGSPERVIPETSSSRPVRRQ